MMLEGAHMLCRERGPEVNMLLHHHIFHGRRLKDTQHKFLIEADPPSYKRPKSVGSSLATSPARSDGACSSTSDETANFVNPIAVGAS